MTASEFQLESLHTTAAGIFQQAMDACSIEAAFDRHIRFEGDTLHRLLPEEGALKTVETLSLKSFRKVHVIAIGKAAATMLDVLLDRMPRRLGLRGVCVSVSIP